MHKNLFIIELNECDFKYFLYGSKKYNFPLINNFFSSKKKLKTYTNDKDEGFNLDPWVQWVSVHTGRLSRDHKIYRLGQKLDTSFDQIWDKLSKKNISSSIWGAFNSRLKTKKNIDLFFPDPWNFGEKAFPQNLNSYLKLPRYYAQNYPEIKKTPTLYFGTIFLFKVFFSKCFFYLLKNATNFLKIFFTSGLKSFNLYFFFDLISLLILKNNLRKNKSKFTVFAMNSFAHYQHNYWNEKKFEKTYFWYLNEMIKLIDEITKMYNSSIIFNGFSQKKIKNEYYLRPKKPKYFFDKLNLDYLTIEPNMTTGAIVKFKTFEAKYKAIIKLKSLKIFNYSIFEVEDFKNKKKIFYRFSLVSLKDKYYPISLQKNYYKNYYKQPKNLTTNNNIRKEDKLLIDSILKETIFMKSSSKHLSNGTLFYNNFSFNSKHIKNNKIHNIKIFKNILNHFS